MVQKKVVTRIAPSPTGLLHVGTARTALFNYLYARKHNGTFVIRVEDTDKERSKKEFEENILEGLAWLGLNHDALEHQSKRTKEYTEYIQKIIDSGNAYVSKEPSKNNPDEEVEVVRLKNPGKEITFTDEIRGDITFDTKELGDFVIARSTTEPLYHLAVVIDDESMGITHVIRGEDHISNTPRQILIQEAFGFGRPVYAHLPLILGADKSKLSKRHGVTSISEYGKDYLKESIINYLGLLGWNPGTEQEFFTLEGLVEAFSLKKIQKGGAIFNIEKLDSINQHYLKEISTEDLLKKVGSYIPNPIVQHKDYKKKIHAVIELVRDKMKKFSDFEEMAHSGELTLYFEQPVYDVENVIWKKETKETTVEFLTHIRTTFEGLGVWNNERIKESIWDYATEKGRGSVLWPLRFALSGRDKSPDPFSIAEILGKEETLSRINHALQHLGTYANE